MHKTQIDEISENHLFPMTLMLEYRTGALEINLQEKISTILRDNLLKQAELVSQNPFKSLILEKPITEIDLEQWKTGTLNPPKRRIAVDQYIKASLASLSDNQDLPKIHELNQFVFLHRFEAYAKHYPDHPAILSKNQTLTYAQVNERANQLAHFLHKKKETTGIKDQKITVSTFLPREPEWIIAILAIWKTGDAFIAIDPTAIGNSPDAIDDYFDKFAQTISDGKPAFILTYSDHQYLLPKPEAGDFTCLCLDECEEMITQCTNENLEIKIDPEDLAYILYTSGSTGKPKGVEIAHRGFMPCLEAHRECVDLTRDSIMAQYATCDFDAWVAEMLILGVGGTLSIVPSDIRLDENRCARYYQDHKINVVIFTPAFLNKLGGPENFPLWRALFIVGETFGWELVKKWKTEKLQIVNGYGLTETTICATLENLDMDEVGKPLSIGKPILRTKILIKIPTNIDVNNSDIEKDYGPETTYQDPESSRSAIDQAGEPWFGGISLTRGYRGEAMQNNAWRFVEIDGERYYKSGDKAILRADGRLEHQGRYSRMVKISGKRIELPSIEANLCQQFQLEKMAVVVTAVGKSLDDKNLTTLLVFLVEKEDFEIDDDTIKCFIRNTEKNIDKQTSLHIIRKKAFPTTQTKINLSELNKSYFESLPKKLTNDSTPETQTNEDENLILSKLKTCWTQVLGIENPRFDADFFELGGHSIDISPLLQAIRREFTQIKDEITNNFFLECRTLLTQTKRIYSLQHPVELIPLKKNQSTDAPYIVFCPPSILGDPEQDYTLLFSRRDEITGTPIFDDRFQVHGLKARGLTNPSLMPTSLYSMAQDYALTIKIWIEKNNKSDIPLFILGWSSGGTLTPEIVNALVKYDIPAYAYVCDSIAPFPFHHFNHEEHTLELVLLAGKLSQAIGLKMETQDLKSELRKILNPRDRIIHCFEYLIKHAKESHRNLLMTAKIIRLAEHNYIIREPLPPIRLYKAKNYLLNGILHEERAHYWPKKCIYRFYQLEENIIDGDHFDMIRHPALAQKITAQIITDFTYHKLKHLMKILEKQPNYVIPFAQVIVPSLNEHEQKNKPSVLFNQAIADFLHNPQKKVLLLQGESGIGKSISAEQLEKSLSAIRIPTKTIMMNRYTCDELNRGIREELKESGKEWDTKSYEVRVLILEGYDERQGTTDFNYYNKNGLLDYHNLKVIFTCRSEALGPNFLNNFSPRDEEAFDDIKLQPFNEGQIKALISIWLKKNRLSANKSDIDKLHEELSSQTELLELVKNPLLLTFVLKSLARLIKSSDKLTRFKIYEAFNKDYFERGEQKVKSQSGIDEEEDFQTDCRLYCQRMALALFSEGLTSYKIKNKKDKIQSTVKKKEESCIEELFKPENKNLLKASPLNHKNKIYQFIHTSEIEYFIVDAILCKLNEKEIETYEIQQWFIDNKLTPEKLVSNISVIKFWSEGYQQYPNLKKKLYSIIDETRISESIKTLGGIVITLLNMATEVFNGANLRGIRVPGAVLNGGYFDCADLSTADLTNVKFHHAWLRNARLLHCQLNGLSFGELPFFQHQDMVKSISYHTECGRLATASGVRVYIWDILSRQNIRELKGHKELVNSVSLTKDGKWVASGSSDTTVRVWNTENDDVITLEGHEFSVKSVHLRDDGNQVISGSVDRTVRVWNVHSQTTIRILRGHESNVTSVHLSSNGRWLASGSWDETIRLWDLDAVEAEAIVLRGHDDKVTSVSLSSNGERLASGSDDGTVRIWNIPGKQSTILVEHEKEVDTVHISPNGNWVASGSYDKTVRISNAHSGQSTVQRGHENAISCVYISDDGLSVASGSYDKTVRVWNAFNQHNSVIKENEGYVSNIQISADGKKCLLSSTRDNIVRVQDILGNNTGFTFEVNQNNVTWVHCSTDGNLLATGSENGMVQIWDMHTRKLILEFQENKSRITSLHSSSDRTFIGYEDGTIYVLDVPSGQSMTLHGHHEAVTSLCLSTNRKTLISCGTDGSVWLWDLTSMTGKGLRSFRILDSLFNVHLSADGRWLSAGGCSDYSVQIWDLKSEKEIILRGHQGQVWAVHLNADGKRLISGSWDKTVRIWDVLSESQTGIINLKSEVTMLSFDERSGLLAVGLADNSVELWDRIDNLGTAWQLKWSSNHPNQSLCLAGCEFTEAEELSKQNEALLIQRGAFNVKKAEKKKISEGLERFRLPLNNNKTIASGYQNSGHAPHEGNFVPEESSSSESELFMGTTNTITK